MRSPSFTRRLRPHPRLTSEHGFAVPTVMLALFACFALASAAVVSSLSAQGGISRDQGSKAALAAAEAGVANAMLRFNRIESELPCGPVGGGAPAPSGWCPATDLTKASIDRGGYRYMVHPTPTELRIVSTGTVDGVTRRIEAVAESAQGSSGGLHPFVTASVVGLDGILLNSNAEINADVATNGDIGLNANSSLNCGHAQVGVGRGFHPNNNGHTTCTPTEGVTSLPPVNPGNVMEENANERICTLDPISPPSLCSSTAAWNPATKRLLLNSGAAITLGAAGGQFNYAFCQIILNSNSYLHIAGGARVRIYFGAPEECNGTSTPLIINSNSKIEPTGSGAPDLALLVLGSEHRSTQITLNSNAILFDCDQSFVLYAPRTDVTINSNTHVCGGLAAKSVLINSHSDVTASNTASEFELPGTESQYFLGYGRPQFVECTAPVPGPAELPDSGC